jgi:FMN-dependent NADH-azoreductase
MSLYIIHQLKGLRIMATVLYLKANPKPVAASFTLRLADAFITAYKESHPKDTVTELDLFKTDLPVIDEIGFSAWGKSGGFIPAPLNAKESEWVEKNNVIIDQFIKADKLIFAAPMWNFNFPPVVKAYIDNIIVAKKTFKYTEKGPVGLLDDKPVILIQARGGVYSVGPMNAYDHAESYLRAILGFIGITNFKTLLVEGVNMTPDKIEDILSTAIAKGLELAKTF